jgi:hypothetical protein
MHEKCIQYSARTFIWFADVRQTERIKEKKNRARTVRNYSIIKESIHFLQLFPLFRKDIPISNRKTMMIYYFNLTFQ